MGANNSTTATATAQIPTYIVDAFTLGNNEPFTGNTAAVCILEYDDDITDEQKQNIAAEMNVAVTGFVSRKGWSKNRPPTNAWTIRWFSPNYEVDFCGHATLASSKVIFTQILKPDSNNEEGEIKFESKKFGSLGATICWETGMITLDFPLNVSEPLARDELWVQELVRSTLGSDIESNRVMDVQISKAMQNVAIYLHEGADLGENEATIRKVKPNWSEILKINTGDETIDSIFVSIKGIANNDGPHYLTRVFNIRKEIQEDPATGSAQTLLGPYWKEQLKEKDGSHLKQLNVRQMSQRGGQMIVTVEGERVRLTANARLIFTGNFLIS